MGRDGGGGDSRLREEAEEEEQVVSLVFLLLPSTLEAVKEGGVAKVVVTSLN